MLSALYLIYHSTSKENYLRRENRHQSCIILNDSFVAAVYFNHQHSYKKKLCNIISKFFYPILKHIFKASQFSSFIIICGFLSGYPLGCKTIFEGLKNNLISEDEAKKLLTFCNNPSISYVINYVSYLCLDSYFKNSIVIMFIFLPPIITGIINSHLFFSKQQVNICNTDNNSSISVLNNTVSSLIKIGMYIIIFTTINAWLSIFISNDNIPLNIITSFLWK